MEQSTLEKQITSINDKSDFVTDFMGKTPNWTVRWGSSLFLIIVVVLVLGSSLISYNDIISGPISITSQNPPVYLKARKTGVITDIFVQSGEEIQKNQVLAALESNADFKDVLKLEGRLNSFAGSVVDPETFVKTFPSDFRLGRLQGYYESFRSNYLNYTLNKTLNPNEIQVAALMDQIRKEESLLENKKTQTDLRLKDLELADQDLERNKLLLAKGVISKAEFEKVERENLNVKSGYQSTLGEVSATRIKIAALQNQLSQSRITGTEERSQLFIKLEESLQILRSEVLSWKQLNLLISPINGTVSLFDIWNKNQSVTEGQGLITVIPKNPKNLFGKMQVPIQNSGKIKKGLNVLIKLANYPYREWGSLQGEVVTISEVPTQIDTPTYVIYISVDSLRTSFDKQIVFRQEMRGKAEIIVEELSVLERILFQVREVLSRQ